MTRRFPIINDTAGPTGYRGTIPWSLAERVYEDYAFLGHSQSLESIASRGGFGWYEMVLIQVEAEEKRQRMTAAAAPPVAGGAAAAGEEGTNG